MNSDSSISRDTLRRFLLSDGWSSITADDRFELFSAPEHLGILQKIAVPVSDGSNTFRYFQQLARTLAEIYNDESIDIRSTLSDGAAVLSVSLSDPVADSGGVELPRYRLFLDSIRLVLESHVSLVATAEFPEAIDDTADLVDNYIERCQFLHTTPGSFSSRIRLPAGPESLVRGELFRDGKKKESDGSEEDKVNDALAKSFTFLFKNVLTLQRYRLNEEQQRLAQEIFDLRSLSAFKALLERAQTRTLRAKLYYPARRHHYLAEGMQGRPLENFAYFYAWLKDKLEQVIDIEVTGRVVELRSRNPAGNRNYVVVQPIDQTLGLPVSATLDSTQYSIARAAHSSYKLVKVKGRAHQRTTRFSIFDLTYFAES